LHVGNFRQSTLLKKEPRNTLKISSYWSRRFVNTPPPRIGADMWVSFRDLCSPSPVKLTLLSLPRGGGSRSRKLFHMDPNQNHEPSYVRAVHESEIDGAVARVLVSLPYLGRADRSSLPTRAPHEAPDESGVGIDPSGGGGSGLCCISPDVISCRSGIQLNVDHAASHPNLEKTSCH
jgi:hypothetical protein